MLGITLYKGEIIDYDYSKTKISAIGKGKQGNPPHWECGLSTNPALGPLGGMTDQANSDLKDDEELGIFNNSSNDYESTNGIEGSVHQF